MKNRFFAVTLLIIMLMSIIMLTPSAFASPAQMAYVIQVDGTIDPGQAKYIERHYSEAEKLQATMVILEIDTPGGLVEPALNIRDTIRHSPVPTTAFVRGGAISAGALITLACKTIAMEPGATIGAAEPRIGTEKADEKYISFFSKEMAATAEVNGRDPQIAAAMVDSDIVIPNLVEKGKLLTLTYQEAKEHGYSDYIVKDRQELLTALNLQDAQIIEATISLAERIMRIVTNPFVAPLLLTLGIAGIVIELFTMGWGIAGTLGLVSLGLYFGGHLLGGFTGWEVVLLFLIGIILLGVEALAPGFGIFGIGGIICVVVSIILTAPSWEVGVISLIFAIIGTVILLFLSFKIMKKRQFLDRFVLGLKFNKEEGYIPQSQDFSKYAGQKGVALTPLRPAGAIQLDDGTRLDVVTVGDFIPQGSLVKVIQIEGVRIVVQTEKGNE
jgi:membrane-bound serine protease (ClpP class)